MEKIKYKAIVRFEDLGDDAAMISIEKTFYPGDIFELNSITSESVEVYHLVNKFDENSGKPVVKRYGPYYINISTFQLGTERI